MNTITTEEFIKEAKEIHSDKYDYSLVEYKGYDYKVKIICPIHGAFEQRAGFHTKKRCGCPACAKEKRKAKSGNKTNKLTTEEFIKKAKEVHGDKYDYSKVEYVNMRTKIKIICPIHGEFEQAAGGHLYHGCKKCYDEKQSSSAEEFIKKAKEVHGDKYDYSKVEYINMRTKIKIICPIHGEFEQQPRAHLSEQGCPKCKSSSGERRIANYLNSKNLLYEWQKTFDDLRGKNKQKLSYDFYLQKENLLIEYNGRQHYEEEAFGGHHNLKRHKERDLQKIEYAKKNNYKLISIPYWEFDNIETILEENLWS